MSVNCLIECRQAAPCYGRDERPAPTLDCLIEPASVTCILGHYRRDVSHYLRMLGAVDRHCAGEMVFFGERGEALDSADRRRLHTRIGFVSSATPLLSILNGVDNVKLPALYHRTADVGAIDALAQRLIGAIDYTADHKVLPAYMTHLQRRHLTIARALIMQPEVLCIEAPFANVDHYSVACLKTFLLQQVEQGIALVVGSDNLAFARQHANQILFIGRQNAYTFDDYGCFLQSPDSEVRDYILRKQQSSQVLE